MIHFRLWLRISLVQKKIQLLSDQSKMTGHWLDYQIIFKSVQIYPKLVELTLNKRISCVSCMAIIQVVKVDLLSHNPTDNTIQSTTIHHLQFLRMRSHTVKLHTHQKAETEVFLTINSLIQHWDLEYNYYQISLIKALGCINTRIIKFLLGTTMFLFWTKEMPLDVYYAIQKRNLVQGET